MKRGTQQTGFTLLEILIAITIASVLGGILFQLYYQVNRSSGQVNSKVDASMSFAIAAHQLEKDISGVCLPPHTLLQSSPTGDKKDSDQKPEKNKAEKPIKKKLTHIFYATEKNNMLETITFVGNNPLDLYVADTHDSYKPRLTRIAYHLEPEKKRRGWNQPSYKLMRYETADLDNPLLTPEQRRGVATYELLDGIKTGSATYYLAEPKKDNESPKQELVYNGYKKWHKEADKDKKNRFIPNAVMFKFELWHNNQKHSRSFTVDIEIIPDGKLLKEKKKTTKQMQEDKNKKRADRNNRLTQKFPELNKYKSLMS